MVKIVTHTIPLKNRKDSRFMKVDELRTVLGKYDASVLKEIAVELYKMIPKNRKEDSGLDDLLLNFTRENAKPLKNDTPVSFEKLSAEIEQFLVYADMQYYLAPNKYVRKEQRSKWRFEVKRFIKDLIKVGGENSEDAGRLLADIYNMLSYACHYSIFSTEDPFSSVGYEQADLLLLVLNNFNPLYQEIIQKQSEIEAKAGYGDQGKSRAT